MGVFLKDWYYLYLQEYSMFPKVKSNFSNLVLNVTAVFPKVLTSGLHITSIGRCGPEVDVVSTVFFNCCPRTILNNHSLLVKVIETH